MQYVYMTCTIPMTTKVMADVLYAVIMTGAYIIHSAGDGIYEQSREENAFNYVRIMVRLSQDEAEHFEQLSGVTLTFPFNPEAVDPSVPQPPAID